MIILVLMQGALFYDRYVKSRQVVKSESTHPVPPNTFIDIRSLPTQGDAKAKFVMVEFSDYECQFCSRHANGVAKDVAKEFVATGKVRYVFANNPLPIHKSAVMLATSAICAGEQNRYWEMHESLFASSPDSKEKVFDLAKGLSLEMGQYKRCMEKTGETSGQIEKDKKLARRLGLTGTPGFALGSVTADGMVHVQRIMTGAGPLYIFESAINQMIAKAEH